LRQRQFSQPRRSERRRYARCRRRVFCASQPLSRRFFAHTVRHAAILFRERRLPFSQPRLRAACYVAIGHAARSSTCARSRRDARTARERRRESERCCKRVCCARDARGGAHVLMRDGGYAHAAAAVFRYCLRRHFTPRRACRQPRFSPRHALLFRKERRCRHTPPFHPPRCCCCHIAFQAPPLLQQRPSATPRASHPDGFFSRG